MAALAAALLVGMLAALVGFALIWAPWAWLAMAGACVSVGGTVAGMADVCRQAAGRRRCGL